MTDLLTHEEQLYYSDFEHETTDLQLFTYWEQPLLTVSEKTSAIHENNFVAESINHIPGQGDLLAKAYRPIREIGSRCLIHMVKEYVHDVTIPEWPKLEQ